MTKMALHSTGERMVLWTHWVPRGEKLNLDSYFISVTNIHSMRIVDLNVKDKSINLLKENIDYLCDLPVVNNFFPSFSLPINGTTMCTTARASFDLCVFVLTCTWSLTLPCLLLWKAYQTHHSPPSKYKPPPSSICNSLLTVLFASTYCITFPTKIPHSLPMMCQNLTCLRTFDMTSFSLKCSSLNSPYGWSILYFSLIAHVTSSKKPSLQTYLYSSLPQ